MVTAKKGGITFIRVYLKCCRAGQLPYQNGLCSEIGTLQYHPVWKLITPTDRELRALNDAGKSNAFWAYEFNMNDEDKFNAFTPLRQTILLLAACINEEY